ncbi:MAG: F0F1 ATP synthase subunit B [Chloroflexi bacterium]|nr:F0F1 ATP synthase subunit B [Chloroflexota bacterium]
MEALGVNLPGLIAQLVNVFLLLGLLYMVLYKPMLKALNQRSTRIKESLDQAEYIKEQVAKTEQQVQERLEAARKEGQAIVAQAGQAGERFKEEARQEGRREAEVIMARARREIEAERDEAIAALRREFADLAILAAEKVTRETLDRAKHRRLIQEVLEESSTFKGEGA